MKKYHRSRTVWLGGIVSILGVLQSMLVAFPIPPLYQGLGAVLLGLAIIMLRLDTDGPVE